MRGQVTNRVLHTHNKQGTLVTLSDGEAVILTWTATPSKRYGSLKALASAVREPLGLVPYTASFGASSFSLMNIAESIKSSMWVLLRSPTPEKSQSLSKYRVPRTSG